MPQGREGWLVIGPSWKSPILVVHPRGDVGLGVFGSVRVLGHLQQPSRYPLNQGSHCSCCPDSIHQNVAVPPTFPPEALVSEEVAYFLLHPVRLAEHTVLLRKTSYEEFSSSWELATV